MNLVTSKFNYVCTVLKVEYKITFLCFQGIKTIPFEDIYKHIYIAKICCDLLLNIWIGTENFAKFEDTNFWKGKWLTEFCT